MRVIARTGGSALTR